MKKIKVLLSFSLIFLFFLTGIVFAKTTINFWYSIPEEYNVHMKKLVENFNEEHQYYHVIVKNFKGPKELKDALDGGNLPDVAIIDACWQNELAMSEKIIPVEDLMNNAGSTLKVVLKMDTFPTLWESCIYNGSLWSLPYYALNQALIYDSVLLREKKIKFPPKSWSDIVKHGKALTSSEDGQWGFFVPLNSSSEEVAHYFQSFLWQAGGEICDSQGKLSINSPTAVKTLNFLRDLVKKHKISPENFYENPQKVAMRLGTSEDFLKLKKRGCDVKVAPLPKNKESVNFMQLSSLVVFKGSKKVEPSKCWYFIYWLSEFPQASFWSLNTPYLPANRQVTLSPEYFEYLENNPEIRVYLAQLKNSRISHNIPGYDEVLVKIGDKVKIVLVEDIGIEEALKQITLEVNSLLNQIEQKNNSLGKTNP